MSDSRSRPPPFFSGPFKAFVWLLRKSDSGIRWQFILRVISSKNPDSFANYLWRLKSQGTFGREMRFGFPTETTRLDSRCLQDLDLLGFSSNLVK